MMSANLSSSDEKTVAVSMCRCLSDYQDLLSIGASLTPTIRITRFVLPRFRQRLSGKFVAIGLS